MMNQEKTIISFFCIVLSWILFFNFIFVSFSVPVLSNPHNKLYHELTPEGILLNPVKSEKSHNNEINRNYNYFQIAFLSTDDRNNFNLLYKKIKQDNYSSGKVHFNCFIFSHFATST